MRPLTLKAKGMVGLSRQLHLSEATLDLSTLSGIVALVGPNGSGKTTVLECLQPWRIMPSRKIGLKDAVELRTSFKDLTFRWDGRTVRSLVTVNAENGSTEGFLWINGESRSSGKVTEHDEQLEALLGPSDVFFNSVFAGQMVESLFSPTFRPAKRKEFFVELLGLGRLQQYSERAKAVVGYLQGVINSRNDALARLRSEVSRLGEIDMQLQETRARKAQEATALQDAAQVSEAASAELREMELAAVDITATRDELQRIHKRRTDYQTKASIQLGNLKTQNDRLQRQRATLESEIVREAEWLARSRPVLTEGELERELAEITASQAEVENLFRAQYEMRLQLGDFQQKVLTATAIRNARKQDADRLERLTSAIPDDADRSICGRCGFAAAGLAAPGEREAAEHELAAVTETYEPQIAALTLKLANPITKDELNWSRQAVENARTALAAVKSWTDRDRRQEERQENFRDITARCEEAVAAERTAREEFDAAMIAFNTEQQLQEEKIAVNRDAATAIAQQQRRAKDAADALNRAQAALHKTHIVEEQLKTRRDLAMQAREELDAAEQQIRKIDADRAEWLFLQTVCGRDRLQALELDAAAPAITQYANELLSQCFGGRFTIQFQTLDEQRREIFDLIVTDIANGKSESLLLKSGGEKVIVLHALRLAIALYGKDRAGRNFETLYMDESEAALAPETRLEFAEMLRAAMRVGGFQLALVVTHSTEVSECADRIIAFDNGSITVR